MEPFEVTGTIQRESWLDRSQPPVERVRDTIWSIPVDFGQSPVRYTFSYLLLNDSGSAVVIDPGWDSELGRAQFAAGLDAAGIGQEAIVGVVSTHFHPDHLGMVRHVSDESHAWVGMSEKEAEQLDLYDDIKAALECDRAWVAGLGAPQDVTISADDLRHTAALARPTLLLADGDIVPLPGRTIRAVATPGHTVGHLCFVDEDEHVVFSGDHVLPRITPNVGMTATGGRRRALAEYFESLERIAAWDSFEVLPAHEYRFRGLAARTRALAAHHTERGAEIRDLIETTPGIDVFTIASRIGWARDWSSLDGLNLRAALGETAAHVEYLVETGKVIATDDGRRRFSAAPSIPSIP